MTHLLTIRGLTKRFGTFTALDRLDMSVKEGEVYGLLGPNGAGKTTLLATIFGLLLPDSGEIQFNGKKIMPGRPETAQGLDGFVDTPAFFPHLSAIDNLRLSVRRRARRLSEQVLWEKLEQVGLTDAAERKVGGFSTGMKKRLGIARALLIPPRLLILDEPTSGLDPNGVKDMRQLVLDLKKAGVSILLSSHILSEVEQIADRVGIIDHGRMVREDWLDALTVTPNTHWFTVDDVISAISLLSAHDGFVVDRVEGNAIQIRLTSRLSPAYVNRLLVENGVLVQAIHPEKNHLEDTFFRIIGIH
ncbi:MAG TPA: ATP-binding cassette domain-containing protein [Anaerolineae bacterium]|nr:ATP-binding cassette domain-containing protein [Anaerolineae bacterium]